MFLRYRLHRLINCIAIIKLKVNILNIKQRSKVYLLFTHAHLYVNNNFLADFSGCLKKNIVAR